MKAAIFRGNGIMEVADVEKPSIQRDDQVLIKVKAASICGSDMHALEVPPGQEYTKDVIVGHEFFGEIVEVSTSVKGFKIGDVVAVNPCRPCGECWECKHGMRNLCNHPFHYGQTIDGGFAEYALVETGQIYHLPADINPDLAAQIEPLACVMYSLNMINLKSTDRVLLYGAGPIGLTYIQALMASGIKELCVMAKGHARMESVKKLGVDFVIDSQSDAVVKDVLFEKWGCLADVVIDAVGAGPILTQAHECLNSRGRIMLFGLNHNAVSSIHPAIFTQKEITMIGSLGKDFPSAISLVTQGRVSMDSFVSHRLPLDRINEGVELLRNKEATRVIIYP